jgi:hypothetical protein
MALSKVSVFTVRGSAFTEREVSWTPGERMTSSAPASPSPRYSFTDVAGQPGNGLGAAAACCGFAGVLVGLIPMLFVASAALAILAIVFGVIGLRRVRRHQASNRGMAISGLITGAAAAGLAAVGIIIVFSGINTLNSDLSNERGSTGTSQVEAAQRTVSHQEQEIIHQDLFVGNG